MSRKNFTQFDLRSPVLTSDYIVGYKEDGSAEYKTTVQQIVNLVQDSDAQTLFFNEADKNLTISNGNTVSLSALVDSSIDTGVRALTAKYEDVSTVVQTNSASWATGGSSESLPLTGGTITGSLVITQNLTADKVELKQSYLDVGTSLTNSISTLYITINNTIYGIPVLRLPLIPASGEDNAAAGAYDDGLGNGDNGGTGFSAWDIDVFDGGDGGYAGTYVGSSTDQGFGNINTSGEAFGLFAGGINSASYVSCIRPFLPLTVGNAVSAGVAVAFRSGDKGIKLLDSNDNELYKFSVGGDEYKINNANLGWGYSQASVFNIVARQIDVNTINIILTRGTDIDSRNATGVVSKIEFYNDGTNGGDLENLRFNSLKLYPYQ
jgi:hypothetical protein